MTERSARRGVLPALLTGEAAGGVVLIAAAALALLAANSPFAPGYAAFCHAAIGAMSVEHWVSDGLMALFFLLVGLEIKRALVEGALADPDARRLPIAVAAAGMAVPALAYLLVTRGDPELARGWAIPAATDIAFAAGVMALLGDRIPPTLKLFLLTVAIVDDIGAVAIIAVVYSHGLDWGAVAAAAGTFAAMMALNRRGVRGLGPYLLLALLLWWLVLQSGVHATIAGVLAAATIPIERASEHAPSPLDRLEHALQPWVAFAVVPLFGFVSAGVKLGSAEVGPLALAVAIGLFVGKQIGIVAGIAIAERTGFARRPAGVGWAQLYGVALLAGIGFTMSLFIGGLAFPLRPELVADVKLGVLGGSLLAGIAGYAVLRFADGRG